MESQFPLAPFLGEWNGEFHNFDTSSIDPKDVNIVSTSRSHLQVRQVVREHAAMFQYSWTDNDTSRGGPIDCEGIILLDAYSTSGCWMDSRMICNVIQLAGSCSDRLLSVSGCLRMQGESWERKLELEAIGPRSLRLEITDTRPNKGRVRVVEAEFQRSK